MTRLMPLVPELSACVARVFSILSFYFYFGPQKPRKMSVIQGLSQIPPLQYKHPHYFIMDV